MESPPASPHKTTEGAQEPPLQTPTISHDDDYDNDNEDDDSPPYATTNKRRLSYRSWEDGPIYISGEPPSWYNRWPFGHHRRITRQEIKLRLKPFHSQDQPPTTSIIPPTVCPPYLFQSPTNTIRSPDHFRTFHHSSDSARNLLGFVVALSHSIHGHKLSDHCHQSQTTLTPIISILETLVRWVDNFPPIDHGNVWANFSFREWYDRVIDNAESLMLQFLPSDELRSATIEIVPYFTSSFGDDRSYTYGLYHETNFVAWLYCLARLGLVKEEDYQAVVSKVFVKYFELMRKLQLTYCLLPPNKHGTTVWGFDEFHFLPFLFGSSQLVGHKYMKPKSIHNQDILDNFSKDYLYLSCVAFVKKVKDKWGPFRKHSPCLDEFSRVSSWEKVHSGLLKMYEAEVLGNFINMQHFLFGWLIK